MPILRLTYGNLLVTIIMPMQIAIREYLDAQGRSPYGRWFAGVNAEAAAKIAVALYRMEAGNFSNVKGVSGGVFEIRINFGPGYRIYTGKEGDRLVILLGGGTKARQSTDIARAQRLWQDYRRRKPRP